MPRKGVTAATICLLGFAGCGAQEPEPTGQPRDWKAAVALAEASDRNPDPHVVEVEIEARVASVELRPGLTTEAWTYEAGRVESRASAKAPGRPGGLLRR